MRTCTDTRASDILLGPAARRALSCRAACQLTAFLNTFVLSTFVPLIKDHVQKSAGHHGTAPGTATAASAKTELIVVDESPQPLLKVRITARSARWRAHLRGH